MPTIKVDGIEVTVEPGTNLIEAALQAGRTVPHFCYHPKLSVAGNCRMCLVDIEGLRKPEIACNTQVRDGMVVYTDSEKVRAMRKGVLEFLFLNHPLDCPICDKAGECKLQDYYLEHGKYVSRLEEKKVRKPKRLDIGDHIILDTERCVLCSRCERFTDEISKTGELRIFERGAHSQIGIYPGKRLNNRYSLCTTDICPVGALTGKEFRFAARVWYLEKTSSICNGCSTGCNIEVHHYKNKVFRYLPRRNDAVNDTWMCDDGRLSYAAQQSNRCTSAAVRDNGQNRTATWRAAVEKIAMAYRELHDSSQHQRVGFVLSPEASVEENYLLARLSRTATGRLFLVGGNPVGAKDNDEDGFLIRADKNPNFRGAAEVGHHFGAAGPADLMTALRQQELKLVIVLKNNIVGKAQRAGIGSQPFSGLALLAAFSSHMDATTNTAQVVMPVGTFLESDGTFINFADRVQAFRQGTHPEADALAGWEAIDRLASAMGHPLHAQSAQQVFDHLAGQIPAFSGMTFESVQKGGQQLKRTAAQAA